MLCANVFLRMTKTISLASVVFLATIAIFAAAPQNATKPSQLDKSTEAARLNNLGAAYMNQQLFEKALKAFEQAAELDPKFEIAQMNQGIALLNLGRIDAARKFLEQAVKQSPDNPHAWYNLGMLEKNSANPQAAADAFHRVTEIDANDADTWYFLGASYAQNEQHPQAIDAFQHVFLTRERACERADDVSSVQIFYRQARRLLCESLSAYWNVAVSELLDVRGCDLPAVGEVRYNVTCFVVCGFSSSFHL